MEDILTLCSRNEQPMHVCMIKRLNIIEPGSRVKALALQATPLYPLGVKYDLLHFNLVKILDKALSKDRAAIFGALCMNLYTNTDRDNPYFR
jgi:hypothetical protein